MSLENKYSDQSKFNLASGICNSTLVFVALTLSLDQIENATQHSVIEKFG